LRGKPWSVEEERRLRELIGEGSGIERISKVMGKTRVSVRSKMYNLGLVLVDASTVVPLPVASLASVASTPRIAVNQVPVDGFSAAPASAAGCLPGADSSNVDLFGSQLKREGPLPSIEQKLRVLDAALVALEKPGLSVAEGSRLNKIILGVKVYNELFAQYVKYKALEDEVVELRKQLASERAKK